MLTAVNRPTTPRPAGRFILLPFIFVIGLGSCFVLAQSLDEATIRIAVSDSPAWHTKKFKGETSYSPEWQGGRVVTRAESEGAASGRYHPLQLSVNNYPEISWSWKIRQTVPVTDPMTKAGDDYAARVYLIFPGRFFWQRRAITYVWADQQPVGTVLPSPFTDQVALIVVESGNRYAGNWREETRNYAADYRSFFHEDAPDPIAVAIMTDTDNTGGRATAWYGDILFRRKR